MNSVLKSLLNEIIYGSNAHAEWEDLKEHFNKVNHIRIFQLHKDTRPSQENFQGGEHMGFCGGR
uniref:Uncharacterized protein n=1 Tax=Solanum tuberosum TaxID=4113 RepID=M1ABU7_SOLTU